MGDAARPGSASVADPASSAHTGVMSGVLPVLVVVAVLATFGALACGIVSMVRGGRARSSNRLMRLRVAMQFAAIVLIGLAFLFS